MSGFVRPKITWHEWEHAPLKVIEKVALELAMRCEPHLLTPDQRVLLFSWYYFSLISNTDGHGTLLFNIYRNKEDETLIWIQQALESLGASTHASILRNSLDRWKSKPRNYHNHDMNDDTDDFATWVRDLFDPIRDEFLDLDEEVFHLKPSLDGLIIDHLRKHRNDFVELI